jgi:hypothetical protein
MNEVVIYGMYPIILIIIYGLDIYSTNRNGLPAFIDYIMKEKFQLASVKIKWYNLNHIYQLYIRELWILK